MSFLADRRLARLRVPIGRLFFAQLLLFVVAFALSFLHSRLVQQWQVITAYSIAGALLFFFWLLPIIRYATTFVDITTTKVASRSGLFGHRYREISLANVAGIELTAARTITITVRGEAPMVLGSVPKRKLVAAELQRLAAEI